MPRIPLATPLVAMLCLLWATVVLAQFPPGDHSQGGPPMGPGGPFMGPGQGGVMGGDMGGGRGRMGRGGGFGGRRDHGDRSSRFEGFLRQMDTNGDGVIQESEVPEERREMLRMISARFGQDPAKGISLDKLRETMAAQRGGQLPPSADASTSKPTDPKDKSKPEEPPLVPGFGIDEQLTPALGFGVRAQPTGRIVLGPEPKLDPQVRAMFDRFDRNHNGVLEQDESAGLPRSVRQFDLNQDNRITLAEVAARVAGDQTRGGTSRGRESDNKDTQDDSVSNENRTKFYRFLSPHERLPKGVPDWFVSRDADFDGQVSMAEFAGYWTTSAVNEFLKYDANHDGIITPTESLATSDAAPSPTATPVGRPSGSQPASPPADTKPSTSWWMP